MTYVYKLLMEQIANFPLIFRLAVYEIKGKYQMHYLGVFWQFLNPLLQIAVYWVVFGMGLRAGAPVGDVPFLVWLIAGLVPWFFISPAIMQASNSIYSKVNLVSKMKFPVSILPSITILSNAFNFFIMLAALGFVLAFYNINAGIYYLQLPYYLFCLFFFLYAVTILTSTISALIRDFQLMIQSVMRMFFFLTPIFWSMGNLPELMQTIVKLNPLTYLVNGFRGTFLAEAWFYEDWRYTFYFWMITLLFLLIGSILHENFKNKFVDYL